MRHQKLKEIPGERAAQFSALVFQASWSSRPRNARFGEGRNANPNRKLGNNIYTHPAPPSSRIHTLTLALTLTLTTPVPPFLPCKPRVQCASKGTQGW